MNRLLLLLSLIAVDCGWDNHSMLIAEMQSEAKASPSPTASAAAEDENKPQVLKTSPTGRFVSSRMGGVLDCHGSRRKATGKNAFGGLVILRSFAFRLTKVVVRRAASRVVYVGSGSYRRSDSKGPNDVGPFQPIEPSLEDGAWTEGMKQRLFTKNFADEGACPWFGSAGGATIPAGYCSSSVAAKSDAKQLGDIFITIRASAGSN